MTPTSAPAAPAVVLDTNVVLDWLVFRDARVAALAQAVEAGRVRWLACARMRDELEHTLRFAPLDKWQPDSERTLSFFDRWAHARPAPPPAPLNLRCRDPDDQVFLELALAGQASWLVTHDRALLQLARRARSLGLAIVPPAGWHAP